MSSHFAAAAATAAANRDAATNQDAPFFTRLRVWGKKVLTFRPDDLSNPNHRRLRTQMKIRAVIVVSLFCYAAYMHPEYSVLSAWWHGSNKPLREQRFERLSGTSAGSEEDQMSVTRIMKGSTLAPIRKNE